MPAEPIPHLSTLLTRVTLTALLMSGTALAATEARGQNAGFTFPELYRLGGVSANGLVLAGTEREDVFDDPKAVIVRLEGGQYTVTRLGALGGIDSAARAISADGSTVVGEADTAAGAFHAFRWREETGMEDLGTLFPAIPNAHSFAHGVSDDGRTVVGYSLMTGIMRAFAWIEGGTHGVAGNEQMHQLSALAGGYNRTEATAVSGDGRYAAGYSDGAAVTSLAVRWDLSGLEQGNGDVVLNLGSLTGMSGWSVANAISADGAAIVGTSEDADGRERAFLWREGADHGQGANPEMLDIGTLGGQESWGMGISRNGTWVVGAAEWEEQGEADTPLAFRWSEETGIESIADWLGRNGVILGATPADALFISDDGAIVSGHYIDINNRSRVYLARVTDGVDPGMMDVANYHASLAANAAAASAGEFLAWLPLNGAHHRPLLTQPELSGDHCVWMTGDFARHESAETSLGLAEIGSCFDLDDSLRVGVGVGTSHARQDLAMGGNSRFDGQYLLGEIGWQPVGTPLVFSLTGMAGHWGVDVRRGYLNGAATDYSEGSTHANAGALRARVDWLDALTLGSTRINPYGAFGISSTQLAGYTETGGAFPAQFNAQTITTHEVRLGVTAVTELSEAATLSTTVEAVHRSGDAPGANGQALGLFGFALGGGNSSQTWVRAGTEIDFRISEGAVVSASLNAASAGRDATFSGSLGFRASF